MTKEDLTNDGARQVVSAQQGGDAPVQHDAAGLYTAASYGSDGAYHQG